MYSFGMVCKKIVKLKNKLTVNKREQCIKAKVDECWHTARLSLFSALILDKLEFCNYIYFITFCFLNVDIV